MMRINKALVLGGMLTVLLLPLAGATNVVSAQNIVSNPDFETGALTDWQVVGASELAGISVVSDNGPSAPGSNAAFLDNQAQAAGLTMKFTSAPGTANAGTVSYSFDLKLGQAANGGVFFVDNVSLSQEGVVPVESTSWSGTKASYQR